eukprot:Plantae.Rhodophyta-Purpureofilum_apyrenoidigerum.ctg4669.p1 GENE.Plantae.Rhodophyta-Purpureofilum_apyrenoidigerum.ctg4669~~Plantae.Rhodophyta-Purpureofilum_apyrenoidigerum.ctg4669.p1  ORF type:complete len:264 (-),score=34.90 Plantae.Rhodophyta-Purpureofilum_apyrenoidigerum.ctg4669:316-1107(-)
MTVNAVGTNLLAALGQYGTRGFVTAAVVTLLLGLQVLAVVLASRNLPDVGPMRFLRRGRHTRKEPPLQVDENERARQQRLANAIDNVAESGVKVKIDGTSKIVRSKEEWDQLAWELPRRFQVANPQLKFDSEVDGVSISTFCARLKGCMTNLVFIEDAHHKRFGAFCTGDWSQASEKNIVGTGECFVFSLAPKIVSYKWTQKNRSYQIRGSNYIAVGSGSTGHAIYLDDELRIGKSYPCETFDNPSLSSSERFECLRIEAWQI